MKKMSRIIGIAVMLVMAFSVAACIPSEVHGADCDCEICKPTDEPHAEDCDCEVCKPPEEPEENEWESVPFKVYYLGRAGFSKIYEKLVEEEEVLESIATKQQLEEMGSVEKNSWHVVQLEQKLLILDETYFAENTLFLYARLLIETDPPDRIEAMDINSRDMNLRLSTIRDKGRFSIDSMSQFTCLIEVKKTELADFSGVSISTYYTEEIGKSSSEYWFLD